MTERLDKHILKTGMVVLGEPMDGVEGLSIFLHPRGTYGVLTELVQKDKKEKVKDTE